MDPNLDLSDLETLLERPASMRDDPALGRVAALLHAASDVDEEDLDQVLLVRLQDDGDRRPRRLAAVVSMKAFLVAGTLAVTTTAAAAGGLMPAAIEAPLERLVRGAVPSWAAEPEPPAAAVDQDAPGQARKAVAPRRVPTVVGTDTNGAAAASGLDVANRGGHRATPSPRVATAPATEQEGRISAPGTDRSSETPAGPWEERPGRREGPQAPEQPTQARPDHHEPTTGHPEPSRRHDPPATRAEAPQQDARSDHAQSARDRSDPPSRANGHDQEKK